MSDIEAEPASARRAASLTQRLLAFAQRQTLDPKIVDVNRTIARATDLLQRSVGPDVRVEVVQAGGLWGTKLHPSQLENAILDICINARDAMVPNSGRITIETANKWLDDRAAKEFGSPTGTVHSLCVSDAGVGMTADVIEKIFDRIDAEGKSLESIADPLSRTQEPMRKLADIVAEI